MRIDKAALYDAYDRCGARPGAVDFWLDVAGVYMSHTGAQIKWTAIRDAAYRRGLVAKTHAREWHNARKA
jgi:hypothetical protein